MRHTHWPVCERDVRRSTDWIGAGLVVLSIAMLGLIAFAGRTANSAALTGVMSASALALAGFAAPAIYWLNRMARALGDLIRREAHARHEARRDLVSGLPNRRYFMERLDGCLGGGADAKRRVVAAFVDLDGFKEINDAFGHDFGDRLIGALAHRLNARLRPEDFLARFGGDEFAILCSPAGPDGAASLARRVTRAFAAPFAIDGHSIRLSASIGVAAAPDHAETMDGLMRCADLAVYEAKRQGRDRAILFNGAIAERREERRVIEADLRAAIGADELRLNYQPIVSCRTSRIVGVEALIRWRSPERGAVPPGVFIPIAEQCGLMPELGDWILNRAMTDAKRWPNLEISINLSPVQLRHVDLEALLRRLLAEHEVDARQFVLEITEGVALDANGRTKSMLEAIRALGFKIALDDFGTGHSSLAYLHDFQFDKIKIDRSFVSGGENAKAITQAAATLGRVLGMGVVAEGVETEHEAVLMTHFGCTELQGYYFSKPVDAAEMDVLLKKYEAVHADVPAPDLRPRLERR